MNSVAAGMTDIPDSVKDVYDELKREITWLHGRWIVYRQLFAQSEKRIDLLNKCAATFFFIIQDVLIGEIQISLSKLTDPARSNKFDNLSLEQLQQRIEEDCKTEFAESQRMLLDDVQEKFLPFREWRNKKLAHLDMNTAMKAERHPLPGVSREMIGSALHMVRKYMNGIEGHYYQSEFAYDMFVMNSDGDHLISMLKSGLRYEEHRRAGLFPYDDWRKSEWADA